MRQNRKRGKKARLIRGKSDDSDGGGNGLPGGLTDEDIQAAFTADNVKGWYLMHELRRGKIAKLCYRGGGGELTKDELLDAYQETMAAVYTTIVKRPGKIKNIVGYTYRTALRRGADVWRNNVRREIRIQTNYQAVTTAADLEDDREVDVGPAFAIINHHLASSAVGTALVAPLLLESKTVKETAERAGVSQSTVKRAKNQLLQELRELLEETEFDLWRTFPVPLTQ
jgi:DNA-directed RNA polymerase specialized sigma24 family protein